MMSERTPSLFPAVAWDFFMIVNFIITKVILFTINSESENKDA